MIVGGYVCGSLLWVLWLCACLRSSFVVWIELGFVGL